jgi:hypothetical protein
MLAGVLPSAAMVVSVLAAATPMRPVVVTASGSCPSADSLARALGALLRAVEVATTPRPDAALVHVHDQGERYAVTIGGTTRVLADPHRRCADRAESAAVVAALVLAPPTFARPKPPPAPRSYYLGLDASVLVDGTPGGPTAATVGGVVRFEIGGASVRALLGAGALAPETIGIGIGAVRFLRFPFDVGPRVAWTRGRFEIDGDAGLAVTLVLAEGRDLPSTASEDRLELGARLAVGARYWLTPRLATFFTVQTILVPRPLEIVVEPLGVVTTTARVRVGLLLGVSASFP